MWLRPADWVVVVLCGVGLAAWTMAAWRPALPGAMVEVRTPTTSLRIDLGVDGVTQVPGRLGNSELTVQGGRIRFTAAPCRNRVCLATGWIGDADAFAACIPNGITLQVRGSDARYDSINY